MLLIKHFDVVSAMPDVAPPIYIILCELEVGIFLDKVSKRYVDYFYYQKLIMSKKYHRITYCEHDTDLYNQKLINKMTLTF
jgi:hypothetical protein